jgi:hypothetical protein
VSKVARDICFFFVAQIIANCAVIATLFGKLQSEIGSASQEFAYGKLGSDDLLQINDLIRGLLLPTIGMSTAIDLIGSHGSANTVERQDEKSLFARHHEVLKMFLDQVQQLKRPLQGGLQHV